MNPAKDTEASASLVELAPTGPTGMCFPTKANIVKINDLPKLFLRYSICSAGADDNYCRYEL